MIYTPKISNYKPFFIQTSADEGAIDTASSFGLVAKSNPFPVLPSAKEPYSNDWKDEDGLDEANDILYYESFDFDVKFYIKTFSENGRSAAEILRERMDEFFGKIRNGEFMIYDSYTALGRQGVRYLDFEEDEYKARNDWARAIFTITFKVNDPITRVVFDDGKLVAING